VDLKAGGRLDNLSKIFTQLNDEGQDKVVKLVRQLSKSRINTGAGSAKPAMTKQKTIAMAEAYKITDAAV
jgi:hypothetical protein